MENTKSKKAVKILFVVYIAVGLGVLALLMIKAFATKGVALIDTNIPTLNTGSLIKVIKDFENKEDIVVDSDVDLSEFIFGRAEPFQ
ncbi:MAG: hypothetical protein PVJ52_02260 [Candidatus Woesebacteria bacterium]|jgi:hypothetical protein